MKAYSTKLEAAEAYKNARIQLASARAQFTKEKERLLKEAEAGIEQIWKDYRNKVKEAKLMSSRQA